MTLGGVGVDAVGPFHTVPVSIVRKTALELGEEDLVIPGRVVQTGDVFTVAAVEEDVFKVRGDDLVPCPFDTGPIGFNLRVLTIAIAVEEEPVVALQADQPQTDRSVGGNRRDVIQALLEGHFSPAGPDRPIVVPVGAGHDDLAIISIGQEGGFIGRINVADVVVDQGRSGLDDHLIESDAVGDPVVGRRLEQTLIGPDVRDAELQPVDGIGFDPERSRAQALETVAAVGFGRHRLRNRIAEIVGAAET